MVAAVAQPQLGVLRDVLHLPLHDPGVAAARHPGGQPLAPVPAVGVLPVGQELAVTAVGEMVGGPLDEGAAQVVAAHAAVPVGEAGPVGGAGGDDEGRVGDDQVVGSLALDRGEEGPLAQVRLGRPGEGQGEAGEAQGAGVEVGGGDVTGVLGDVQRLDARAAAEVQGAGHGGPHRDARQGRRGAADPEDEPRAVGHARRRGRSRVHGGTDAAGAADRAAEVGDDPPVLPRGTAVGPYVHRRSHRAAVRSGVGAVQPAVGERVLDRERGTGPLVRHGPLEQEQPYQRLERSVTACGAQRGHRFAAGQGGVGGGAEQLQQSVGGEAGGEEGIAQPGKGRAGGGETVHTHAPIVP